MTNRQHVLFFFCYTSCIPSFYMYTVSTCLKETLWLPPREK